MYKDLKAYLVEANLVIPTMSPKAARDFLPYHFERVRDFQHERLVHLIVTLFFGALLIFVVFAIFTNTDHNVALLLGFATALILVTEMFYIGYYYFLENNIQKLYLISQRIHQIANSSLT